MGDPELEELIRRAADGDEQAATEITHRYERVVRARIRRSMGTELRGRVETDDVFQSAIMASLDDIDALRYQGENAFVGWLCTVAERRVRDAARYHRAAKRDHRKERPIEAAAGVPVDRTSPSRAALRNERTATLREAVALLPEPDRQVVLLHSFEGLGFREVAEKTGLADKNAARYVFQRALSRLEDLLDEERDEST